MAFEIRRSCRFPSQLKKYIITACNKLENTPIQSCMNYLVRSKSAQDTACIKITAYQRIERAMVQRRTGCPTSGRISADWPPYRRPASPGWRVRAHPYPRPLPRRPHASSRPGRPRAPRMTAPAPCLMSHLHQEISIISQNNITPKLTTVQDIVYLITIIAKIILHT